MRNVSESSLEGRFLDVQGGRLHYLDEGAGPPVVFVHGTPSSSHEFSHLVEALGSEHRCIAPDHLGFGRSERPKDFSYSLSAHRRNLEGVLRACGIDRFSLVVHDFGGPIALPLAMANPERVERLVILNSWCWPMSIDPKFAKTKKFIDTPLMKFLYLRGNFSASQLVKASWGTHRPLTKAQHRQFKEMFPNKDSRLGTWAFARSLANDEEFSALSTGLPGLRDIPTMVIWGKADALVGGPHLQRWKDELPDAEFVELEDVGHFPQVEAAEQVLAHVRPFLAGKSSISPIPMGPTLST